MSASKSKRKPKRCQWLEGFYNSKFSGLRKCTNNPIFEVHANGECVGWICPKHVIDVTQQGFQIR